ncbi:hypothetical protein CY34DRAFT_237300 [Suillus luteus UH-Slu-Lm8-n1]|uniref:Hydrophobin n=1 Tax=Suillus luteus UH-Slu-Lm8-n1 TaxID=930992 RepID=A0A0C9ZT31_9AGAM|nr:hypothetical protein CY34DRAFT_237300 [Suillus luteus UH-Slu-Lm8-n1]
MFVRAFVIFAILLLISQASVKAATNSTDCSGGTALCCAVDSSDLDDVNDEQCDSFSDPCETGYIAVCCYAIASVDYYYCNQTESG